MTPFPSRLSASLLVLELALALPAMAQEAPPGAPRSILPPPAAEVVAPPAANEQRPAVETTSLTQGSAFRLGILDDSNGGFAATLWHGTTPATVTTLLPNLPIAKGSPAIHDLTRRLLLSAATLTPATDSVAALGDADRVVIAARLHLLAARGDLDGLMALVGRIGRELDDDDIARLKTDAFLLSEDYEEACATASAMIGEKTAPEWLKILAFCRAITGDRAGAALTVDLLQEQAADEPVYYRLLAARLEEQSSAPLKLTSLHPATPLLVAMALELGLALPDDTLDGAPPLVLTKLATTPALAIAKRLQAARAVAEVGGMTAERLKEIFAAVPFKRQDRIGAALVAATLSGAAADALLYQGIVASPAGLERARMAQAASARARDNGSLSTLAVVAGDALAEIAPNSETLPAAVDIARLLLLAGRPTHAAAWFSAVRAAANGGDAKATAALVELWPLMIVGVNSDDVPWSPEILDLWWQGRQSLDETARIQQGVTLYTLLEALGHGVPETAWAAVRGDPAVSTDAPPSDPVWNGMIEAGSAGRVGETVLGALIVCGEGGPGKVPPIMLASVVHALKDVGLDADARRLAVEALVAHGF